LQIHFAQYRDQLERIDGIVIALHTGRYLVIEETILELLIAWTAFRRSSASVRSCK
jgi:hypothetical protein